LARYGKGYGDLDKEWSQPLPPKPKHKEKIDGAATMKSKDELFGSKLETSKQTPLLFGKDTNKESLLSTVIQQDGGDHHETR